MKIGSIENASANFIQPDWLHKGKRQDENAFVSGAVKPESLTKKSVDELSRTLGQKIEARKEDTFAAAYGVDISDEGYALQQKDKAMNMELTSRMAGDSDTIEVVTDFGDLNIAVGIAGNTPMFSFNNDNYEEVFSLADNMVSIELCINDILTDTQNDEYGGATVLTFESLAKALNAYGHKQSQALDNKHDKYLNGVLERLDKVDPEFKNPLVNEIRSMVEQVKSGKDIEWDSEEFADSVMDAWSRFGKQRLADIDLYMKQENDAGKYFTQKMAVYSYMQEMQRQAEEMSIIDQMLGDKDGNDQKVQTAGEVQRKSSLNDGMKAYKHDLRIRHILNEDDLPEKPTYGETASGYVIERPNEEKHNSALGYDWGNIMREYLKENPDLAAIVR